MYLGHAVLKRDRADDDDDDDDDNNNNNNNNKSTIDSTLKLTI